MSQLTLYNPSQVIARNRHAARSAEDMPTFSPRLFHLFNHYLRRYLARNFHAVRIMKDGYPPAATDRPLIVYTNHPAWWDAVVFMHVFHHFYPQRAIYAPMEASALERYKIFKRFGLFGIDKHTASGARKFLRISRHVLAQPNAMLGITAQGDFMDVRSRPVKLRQGLGHLVHKLDDAIIVPLAAEYAFWQERFAEVLLCFGEPIDLRTEPRQTPQAWTQRLESSLEQTMNSLAAAAIPRDVDQFDCLIEGNAGVGGIYDVGRRLKAWLYGRSFNAHHQVNDRPPQVTGKHTQN